MKHLFSLMALTLSLGAMAQATPDTVCTLNCEHPGYRSFSETYPTTGGDGETVSREYILHVPAGYDAALAHPLVIVYHGFGDCASYWEEYLGQDMGFNALADEEGFLVAYPQGAYRPRKSRRTGSQATGRATTCMTTTSTSPSNSSRTLPRTTTWRLGKSM